MLSDENTQNYRLDTHFVNETNSMGIYKDKSPLNRKVVFFFMSTPVIYIILSWNILISGFSDLINLSLTRIPSCLTRERCSFIDDTVKLTSL